MIMNQFIKDLYIVLNSNECFHYFAELMQDSVREEVYKRYKPTQYKRREEKRGLLDKKNYSYKVSITRKGIRVFMRNLTKNTANVFYIDKGIVEGVDFYDWETSNIYALQEQGGFPRDFYSYMEILVEDREHTLRNIIKRQLKKKGWKAN